MIRTKLAKKVLTKSEQKHLTEVANVHNMAQFENTRRMQREMCSESMKSFGPDGPSPEPCHECWWLAKKLGMEGGDE